MVVMTVSRRHFVQGLAAVSAGPGFCFHGAFLLPRWEMTTFQCYATVAMVPRKPW